MLQMQFFPKMFQLLILIQENAAGRPDFATPTEKDQSFTFLLINISIHFSRSFCP